MSRGQGQPSRGRRRGAVFPVRITEDERAALALLQQAGGPRALGPWLLWRALDGVPLPRRGCLSLPRRGSTPPARYCPGAGVLPDQEQRAIDEVLPELEPRPVGQRLILDLCAGSGAWSEPYRQAGYPVERVTLPAGDVRIYVPPPEVWGVLAAPPCQEFSGAKRGPRDFIAGMACVNACLRIVLQVRPRWWALENPANGGHLTKFLGPPRDLWEPADFGDAWTKRTAVWGDFAIPRRGPFVQPQGSAMDRPTAAARALTPPGFARAFFEANP